MRKVSAAGGAALSFAVAPGVVAGAVPWALTGWRLVGNLPVGLRAVGGAVTLVAAVLLIHSFVRFVIEGSGTPVPSAPTERLVVGGLYRYVRNPMYLAVFGAVLGQALLLGQAVLVPYARRSPGRRRVLRPLVRGTDAARTLWSGLRPLPSVGAGMVSPALLAGHPARTPLGHGHGSR